MLDSDTLLRFLQKFFSFRSDYIICLLICEILYSVPGRYRKYPKVRPAWLPVPVGILLFLAFGYCTPIIRVGRLSAALNSLMIFFVSIALLLAVQDISGWRALFICSAAYTTQNLALNIYEVAAFLTRAGGWPGLLLKLGTTGIIYALCYFRFAKKCQNRELHLNKLVLLQLLLTTVFISNFLYSFVNQQYFEMPLMKIPLAICCFLTLNVQFNMFIDSSLHWEKDILEQMLYREQKQHQLMQETIDVINIKSHDLKKQISLLRQNLGEGSNELIREVENAVSSYDSLVHTGNKNLDLIISEEKLLCEKYRIPFDVMADGSAVEFIQPVDLYSLIGNALRNAVENSVKENEKQRSICLDIHTVNGYACIEISNYCTQEIRFAGGFPVTSKGDAKFHGFGMKSMEYVVKKYGGNMVIRCLNKTFIVKVIFPLLQEEKKAVS